jgi:S-adenosylmethionine:tRNA ribosyltransferase-isomerase
MGVKCLHKLAATLTELQIQQWDVYESPLNESKFSLQEALDALLQWMELKKLSALIASTQILIAPGYQYRVINAIVTNFHQPQSTLLLLVAAAVGDNWKRLYEHALANDFRFLSYGDGSLLFIENTME